MKFGEFNRLFGTIRVRRRWKDARKGLKTRSKMKVVKKYASPKKTKPAGVKRGNKGKYELCTERYGVVFFDGVL